MSLKILFYKHNELKLTGFLLFYFHKQAYTTTMEIIFVSEKYQYSNYCEAFYKRYLFLHIGFII